MNICPIALYQNLLIDLDPHLLPGSDDITNPFLTLTQANALLQKNAFLKKFLNSKQQTADSLALEKFLSSNEKCRNYVAKSPFSLNSELDCLLLSTFNDEISKSLSEISAELVEMDCSFGPGASNGVKGKSFYHKVAGDITMTSKDLYCYYIQYIRSDSNWLLAEKTRRLTHELRLTHSSKMCFVPKNDDCSRVICVEPSLNMFFQKGLGRQIETIIASRYKINISDQQFRNRRLARRGSIDNSFSTIDLSSASDSISLALVSSFSAPVFQALLDLTRSTHTTLPNGEEVELFMTGSQGNATTFPLETLIFTCATVACYKVLNEPLYYNTATSDGNFGIFGDDIICKPSLAPHLIRLLDILGFSTNESKTFLEGPFKESCGGDYYKGRFVRPIYMKNLSNKLDVYSILNRLMMWSSRTGIQLHNTFDYLYHRKMNPVPILDNEDAGFKVPSDCLNLAYNSNRSIIYKSFDARTISYDANDADSLPKVLRVSINHSALMLSFVLGKLHGGSFFIDSDRVRPKKMSKITPNWDYYDRTNPPMEDFSFPAWCWTIREHINGIKSH